MEKKEAWTDVKENQRDMKSWPNNWQRQFCHYSANLLSPNCCQYLETYLICFLAVIWFCREGRQVYTAEHVASLTDHSNVQHFFELLQVERQLVSAFAVKAFRQSPRRRMLRWRRKTLGHWSGTSFQGRTPVENLVLFSIRLDRRIYSTC